MNITTPDIVKLNDETLNSIRVKVCNHFGFKPYDENIELRFAIFHKNGKIAIKVDDYYATSKYAETHPIYDFAPIKFIKFGFLTSQLPSIVEIHVFQVHNNSDQGTALLFIDRFGLRRIMTKDMENIWRRSNG